MKVHKSPMKKCDDVSKYSYEKCDDVDFDTNINRDIYMKVMFIFIDIKPRVAYKHIYLYHVYCYLHHLCTL